MVKQILLPQSALVVVLVSVLAASALGLEMKAFQMREDFDSQPLSECMLQYYYHIPCPTWSWFWAFSAGCNGDMLGAFFEIGDLSTGIGSACDPNDCHSLVMLRFLDFWGYGTTYPGLFTLQFDIYCADDRGCPAGPILWSSGPYETQFGWNYVTLDEPLCLTDCAAETGPPTSRPRVLIVSTNIGTDSGIAWGCDNVSTPVETGCQMHDVNCLPALYPRPINSHYAGMHSGFYGIWDFDYCPPLPLCDGRDTTSDCTQFGCIELAWRIYLSCTGPTHAEPTTWGAIKSIYR